MMAGHFSNRIFAVLNLVVKSLVFDVFHMVDMFEESICVYDVYLYVNMIFSTYTLYDV